MPECALNVFCCCCRWPLGRVPYISFQSLPPKIQATRGFCRTAIEYHPASNSSQSGMPIFGQTGAFFLLGGRKKQKVESSWQPRWAVTASCSVLLLRTRTVKHVAGFLKSSYLWLYNCSLDILLLFNIESGVTSESRGDPHTDSVKWTDSVRNTDWKCLSAFKISLILGLNNSIWETHLFDFFPF